MASPIIPLSRRPWWPLLLLVPLGVLLLVSVFGAVNSSAPFPTAEWLFIPYLLGFIGLWYWNFTTLAVTDYDADYLYLFQKNGTQQIPLSSFYKLVAGRGCRLFYLNAQQKKQEVEMIPLNPGWFRPEGDSSIHGFIDAVWQHNPNLDVRHGLFG